MRAKRGKEMGELRKWDVNPVGVNDGLSMDNEEEGDVRV